MPALDLRLGTTCADFAANRSHTLALNKRGQILPRERVARLLDPGVPLPLARSMVKPRSSHPPSFTHRT